MYESLINKWADIHLDAETDIDGNEIENADYRRIKYLLHYKTSFERKN